MEGTADTVDFAYVGTYTKPLLEETSEPGIYALKVGSTTLYGTITNLRRLVNQERALVANAHRGQGSMTLTLEEITLSAGAHKSPEQGMCLLEAVAYVAGEPFSDHPKCVSPVIAAFGRRWNDDLDDEG